MRKEILIAIFWLLTITGLIIFIGFASRNELAGVNNARGYLAGFWVGLVHGFLSLIALVISLFNRNIGIYEIHNSGFGYNAGFVIGLLFWTVSPKLYKTHDNRPRN